MQPGDIFSLPSADPERGDPKDGRPHVLVSLLSEDGDVATVAYCSTEQWEATLANSPHVVVDQSSGTFSATGLSRSTVVYVGRLAVCDAADLTVRRGRIIDEMPQLETQLLRAIGFRTGVSRSSGQPASGSLRGVLVSFRAEFAEFVGFDLGLIVSDPLYSREAMFQNFVPVVQADEYGESGLEIDVATTLQVPMKLWAIPRLIQSCHHDFDIASIVGHTDDASMRHVEDALAVRFFGSVIQAETVSL